MTFTATYRDKTGAMREERVEAVGRSEAVAALKAQGIVPIRVEAISGAKAQRRRPQNGESAVSRRSAAYVLAAVFILLAGGGLWWWLGGGRGEPALPPEKPKSAATTMPPSVTPAQMAKPTPPQTVKPRKVLPKGTPMPERKPPKTYRDENGILRYEGGMRARDPERPHHVAKRLGPDPLNDTIFKTRPENEIAMLLTASPGDMVLSLRRYDDAFEAEFMKSLENDLEVTDDDTPATAELKRVMAETKKEIAERMKNGEKLGEILEETRSELRRLADYRRNMERMLAEAARNPENSERDVADFIDAANKILTENGMKPVSSGILRKNLIMRVKKQKKETMK